MKAGAIRHTTDVNSDGPRIVVQDYYGNKVLASTEDLLNTSGWRELLADFATGPQTRLIAIKVMRVPGNPLIKGTFWLDDVKLTWLKPQRSITRHRVTLPMLVHRCSRRLDVLTISLGFPSCRIRG
jgi:hypothetical protein